MEHKPRDRLFLFVGRTNHDSSVSFIGYFSAFFAKLFVSYEGFCLCLHLSLELVQTWKYFHNMQAVIFLSVLSISRRKKESWHAVGLEYSMFPLVILFQQSGKDHRFFSPQMAINHFTLEVFR